MEKEFKKILFNYRREIEKGIKRFFDKEIAGARQPFLKEILFSLKEFSLRPAKRIRPILVIQGYLLAGGREKRAILKASIFIELIHNFLLIHDDIIDQDELRRGRPTIHLSYLKFFSSNKKEGKHLAQSMAMVAGDMIFSLGYRALVSSPFPEKRRIKAAETLNRIIQSTCYGQMLEVRLAEDKRLGRKVKEEDIFRIYRSKTAFYSFVGPLQLGAILAGAKDDFLKKIKNFALPLGIAFQIQDDIKDFKKEQGKKQPTLVDKINSTKHYREIMEKLTKKSRKSLASEKSFSGKEKQFLLDFLDQVIIK